MAKQQVTKPTDAELAILGVLWDCGPSTVRQVTNVLHAERGTGYTTTLKLLQIMTEKGLVKRDESERTHVYRAAAPRATMQKRLVKELLDRAFRGSAATLVMQALSAKRATPDELAEIRKLIEELERDAL